MFSCGRRWWRWRRGGGGRAERGGRAEWGGRAERARARARARARGERRGRWGWGEALAGRYHRGGLRAPGEDRILWTAVSWAQPSLSVQEAIDRVKQSPAGKVKLAVVDIDGVLRGKYLHKDKFLSAVEGGLRVLQRGVRLGLGDVCYDNARYTGWHTGYPDAVARIDPSAPTARCPGTTRCPSSWATSRTSGRRRCGICPRQLLKRVVARARAAGLLPAHVAGVRVVQLPGDAAVAGRQGLHLAPAPDAGDVRLLDPAAEPEPPVPQRAVRRAGRLPACRSRGCTPRPARACSRRRSSTPTRWRRPTGRCCSRPGPRRSATASGSCPPSWPSGTPTCPAAAATSTRACGTADGKQNLFHDAARPQQMSALFESYLAGQLHTACPSSCRSSPPP